MTTDIAVSSETQLPDLTAAITAATSWLIDHLGPGDIPDDVAGHTYRVPFALALAGRRTDAARLLSWWEDHILDGSGDFREGPVRDGFTHAWSSYPLALMAEGAWHLERYQTAESIRQTLHAFQDPASGGAYAERPEVRITGRQDLFPTAQLGMTGLTIGDDVLADGAFRWLTTLYELQPELPGKLYTATDGTRLLSTPEDISEDRFGMCTDFQAPRQAFYNPGIAAAFLARYSARHGSEDARKLADAYLSLSESGDPVQFDYTDSVQICKFAWGAANLLDLDPSNARYRGHVERMARWFLDSQAPDGHWENSPFLFTDGPTVGSNVEVTIEFVQHLVFVSAALAGSAARA